MAEIPQESGKANGKVRVKKQSTRIDMTPMVDLAFLLLTFFILTSTFNEVYVMQLTMPEKVDDPHLLQPIKDDDVLNLVLAENNKIYWWIGLTPPAEMTNFSKDGVRKIILEKSKANPKLMVLVKPKDGCRFENMVDRYLAGFFEQVKSRDFLTLTVQISHEEDQIHGNPNHWDFKRARARSESI